MKLFSWYRKTPLIVLNFSAFILGVLIGLLLWKIGSFGNLASPVKHIVSFISPFGNILVNMLKMVVIPVIFFSLITGTTSLPLKQFGRMGVCVFIWYIATSLFAAIFGSLMALLCNPTLQNAKTLASKMMLNAHSMQTSAESSSSPLLTIIFGLFQNPFEALSKGNFLPIIVFSILFGLAARVVMDTDKQPNVQANVLSLVNILEAIQCIVFKLIDWVMAYFPIGVFALTTGIFATFGVPLLVSYSQVALCVIAGIVIMIMVIYPLMILVICRRNPYPIIWRMREPILTAFVTRSSAAALPVSLRTAQTKLHVKRELSGFTLSLGATVNMDGVCIHLPVFAVLAANLFGFEMGFTQIFSLIISVVFASVGAGGVPGGSIFLLFMVLECFNLTPEQVSLIVALALGINPLLDMFETACNVAGDNVGTYIVGKCLNMIDDKEA